MRKTQKKTVLLLVLCLVFSMLSVPAYAADEAADPYAYKYEGTSVETSSHRFTFQWMRGDTEWERVRNKNHAANIFRLAGPDGDTEAAYCADFLISAVSGAEYKRINLEDSTYYSDAAARHIRGIMNEGYWYTWTSADLSEAEAAANAWIAGHEPGSIPADTPLPGDAEDAVEPILGLTADEALLATQLAVWAFANTEGDGFWVKYYESFASGVEGQYDYSELPNNVKAFRNYLIHQGSEGAAPEDIVFSDQYFVTEHVIFSGKTDEGPTYDVTVKFRLAAPVDERDELKLTAELADREPLRFALNGGNALTPDEAGYYTVKFTGVTEEETEVGVRLVISGKQYVDGVYFYEAKPTDGDDARETSQNLVGRAEGMTLVSAETLLQLEAGTQTVALHKIDSETERPLAGAEFDLYAEKAGDYLLVYSGLKTDKKGDIYITDLPEDYNYYFVETKAPEGYEAGNGEYIPAEAVMDGEEPEPAVVTNTKSAESVPDPGDDPSRPAPDGTYQTGDEFDKHVYMGLMVLGVLAMIAAGVRLRKFN